MAIPGNFNPRSREGSDFLCWLLPLPLTNFNPRSREGSDTVQTEITTMTKISIHAPAKGATVSNCFITNIYFLISIHAPAKGATEFTQWQTGESVISIHAPAKGATIR